MAHCFKLAVAGAFGATLTAVVPAAAQGEPASTPVELAPAPAAQTPAPSLEPEPAPETEPLPPPPPPRGASSSASGQPSIQVETPAPQPARARSGYRTHDGFYLRLGLGLGTGHAGVSADTSAAPDWNLEGGSLVLEGMVGGTPARGLAVGGALMAGSLGADRVALDGEDALVDVSGQYALIAAFVDGFPNPTGGFHLGGALGLAGVRLGVPDESPLEDFDGGGLGLAAWVGYDAWISSEWSLGGKLQFIGVITRQERDSIEEQGRAGGVSLAFVTLFH